MGLLLDRREDFQVTEAIREAAASNNTNGKEVVELLLTRGGVLITKAVVKAEVINQGSGGEIVRLLLSRGDIQIMGEVLKATPSNMPRGEPLTRASEGGCEAVVPLLLEKHKVCPDSRDRRGWMPLSWVARNEHIKVAELLLVVMGAGRPCR
ncbi:hypothetical protein FGG08_004505 [Glutinoglossum americanum]|uniref:Ankyrin n=1 Tax=Glutinoglossum americanum TaxID=1670608 RepID=A0A9P8I919_9PEZI|nr:hypothetical protein FGG08_004505 [Glutinoglossum americanum]